MLFERYLNAIWALLGRYRALLGRYRALLGRYWGAIGRYWGAVGRYWGAIERYWGAIGRYSAKHVGNQGSLQKTHNPYGHWPWPILSRTYSYKSSHKNSNNKTNVRNKQIVEFRGFQMRAKRRKRAGRGSGGVE